MSTPNAVIAWSPFCFLVSCGGILSLQARRLDICTGSTRSSGTDQ